MDWEEGGEKRKTKETGVCLRIANLGAIHE
jgi:hypothetical protein